jgi:hypothetical protein
MATTDEAIVREVLATWEQVWHAGRYDLIPACLAPRYTRHGSYLQGTFSVTYTPAEYAQVLAAERERSQLLFAIQDQAVVGDRLWLRLTLYRTHPDTGQVVTRPALQVYRLEDGKFAETWVAYQGDGTTWPDTPDQVP